jgi:hypothetical protein
MDLLSRMYARGYRTAQGPIVHGKDRSYMLAPVALVLGGRTGAFRTGMENQQVLAGGSCQIRHTMQAQRRRDLSKEDGLQTVFGGMLSDTDARLFHL